MYINKHACTDIQTYEQITSDKTCFIRVDIFFKFEIPTAEQNVKLSMYPHGLLHIPEHQNTACITRDCNRALQALRQMAVYLGYTCTRSYLSDVIVSLVTAWKAEGLAFSAFPCQIFGFRDQVEFLRSACWVHLPV